MSKQRFLSYIQILKYKEPLKIHMYINTIENYKHEKNHKNEIKKQKKNIDINDVDYSKNFWNQYREI